MKKILTVLMLSAIGLAAMPATASTTFAKARAPQARSSTAVARHGARLRKHKLGRKLCFSGEFSARKARKGLKRRVGRGRKVTPAKPAVSPTGK